MKSSQIFNFDNISPRTTHLKYKSIIAIYEHIEKEIEEANENYNLYISSILDLAKQGSLFIKIDKYGIGHERILLIDLSDNSIVWKTNDLVKKVYIDKIVDIKNIDKNLSWAIKLQNIPTNYLKKNSIIIRYLDNSDIRELKLIAYDNDTMLIWVDVLFYLSNSNIKSIEYIVLEKKINLLCKKLDRLENRLFSSPLELSNIISIVDSCKKELIEKIHIKNLCRYFSYINSTLENIIKDVIMIETICKSFII